MSEEQGNSSMPMPSDLSVVFLRICIAYLITSSVAYLIVVFIFAPDQPVRTIGPVIFLLVGVTALFLQSRGKNKATVYLLAYGIWAAATCVLSYTGGLRSSLVIAYPMIILLAGWLLGSRTAFAFAALTVAVTLGFALAEWQGLLPLPLAPPALMWIVQAFAFIFSAILIHYFGRGYQARLSELSKLSSDLAARGEALAASDVSYRGLFNNVSDAICVLNREGIFVDVNESAIRMYGHPREYLVGRTPQYVFAPGMNDLDEVYGMAERAFAGEPQRFESWGLRANGETFPMDIRLVRGVYFGQAVVIATAEDITERKRVEEEVRCLNIDLENRVKARTADLTAANRELESFAYSISHDLRAPLRGIDGFSKLLLDDYSDKLDEQGRGYLDRVRRAAQRMGALIDDILELSRVSRFSMRRENVDLSRVGHEILEELARAAPQRKVEIHVAPGCSAVGDPQLLRVLLQNLLENAWKYTGRTDEARIEFGCEMTGGQPVFHVRDNGVGFDMQYASRLFSPFKRLHGPEDFEGTGIGLATVARVVHRHGGRVWAESEVGHGTTFRFTLP